MSCFLRNRFVARHAQRLTFDASCLTDTLNNRFCACFCYISVLFLILHSIPALRYCHLFFFVSRFLNFIPEKALYCSAYRVHAGPVVYHSVLLHVILFFVLKKVNFYLLDL